MKLALWTPSPRAGWWGLVVPCLAREVELTVVERAPEAAPIADVHMYHVADHPAHGFVYRALGGEPGVIVLDDWCLHELVRAETVGHGDAATYRGEARRDRGAAGTFVADQVLAGRGGALPSLLSWNDRVLQAALALATTRPRLHARALRRLAGYPVVLLPRDDAEAAAIGLVALALAVHEDRERLRRKRGEDRAPAGTLLALALDEVRPAAHALGLARVPADVRELLDGLLPGRR